jgi:4-hydroxythreonine-4-phosphate dehydrogenase
MTERASLAPLVISSGDPAGIGPEIIGKAWAERLRLRLPCFFAVGDANAFAAHWDGPIARISSPEEALSHFRYRLPILHVYDCAEINPGVPDLDGANCALQAMEIATGFAKAGHASALVTGPISKAQLYAIGFTHPGQTEFVAERCGIARENAVMMLAGPDLRVVPITTHIPFSEVPQKLETALIRQRIIATAKGLSRDFGIERPRIAIAGLNPHAGESGKIGREEIDLFEPVINELKAEGLNIIGPLSADTMFHKEARAAYDVALCSYHDQALIPIKTLYFHEAVNMTLGLPIVRTSPDHGTAFDRAGKNIARPDSMIAAIQIAAMAAENRSAAPIPSIDGK